MSSLPNYPFLDKHEFRLICEEFAASIEERDTDPSDWQSVQCRMVVRLPRHSHTDSVRLDSYWLQDNDCFLRMSRAATAPETEQTIQSPESPDDGSKSSDEMMEEIDEEALPRQADRGSQKHDFHIEYDLLLSPSYFVPVLYFSVRDSKGQLMTELEMIYILLVPQVYRSQMRDVGIMGGLSMAVSSLRHLSPR